MPGLLSRWLEKAQKKMALHKPKCFPTHYHYTAFFACDLQVLKE